MDKITIAVDVMGGDYGPKITIPACLQVIAAHPKVQILAVGEENILNSLIDKSLENITIIPTTETITMDESFISALRKRDSSMRTAITLVKNNQAQACVSAGNTGALMALSHCILKTIPGIDRPAILCLLPTKIDKPVYMLDLGANVECNAEHLFQFAIMATALITATQKNEYPSIALLNIGSEIIKGTDAVKLAFDLLSKRKDLNFVGFIEGDEVYNGQVDIVVCDGFVGNVALKTSEGIAKFILNTLKTEFSTGIYQRILGFFALPIFKNLSRKFDPNKYNGASLLGLQGVVIKSHGKATQNAFATAIETAIKEAKENVPNRIAQAITDKLQINAETI